LGAFVVLRERVVTWTSNLETEGPWDGGSAEEGRRAAGYVSMWGELGVRSAPGNWGQRGKRL
jgi:hypothetical protein